MSDSPDRGDTLEELRVWHRALDLMVECHLVSRKLSAHRRRSIRDQLERASSAIAANIAEGHGRARPREFLHSLDIARGELRETQAHLEAIVRLGFVTNDETLLAVELAEDVARMLSGLRTSILRRHTLE